MEKVTLAKMTIGEALTKGVDAHNAGALQIADRYYTAILKIEPRHPDANHNLGLIACKLGKYLEALPLFELALEMNKLEQQYWLS